MQRPKRLWLWAAAKHRSQAPQHLRSHPLYGLPLTTRSSPSSKLARRICCHWSDSSAQKSACSLYRTPFWLTMLPMPQLSWITPRSPVLPP